jgi:hypothetical protein
MTTCLFEPGPKLEDIPLVSIHGVPSAQELQRLYERKLAERRAALGPAKSTLDAADYLIKLNDPQRFANWLLEHSREEHAAIIGHIDKAKDKP